MHYQKPSWATKHIGNPAIATLTRLGVSVRGSRILAVRGRKSGEWRATPVNPLPFEGQRYLVAPRGETHWVRNIRASHEGQLRVGRRIEDIRVSEVSDADKVPILRAYLQLWAFETKVFFDVAGPNVPDDELRRIAPEHPVFRLVP